MALQGKSAVGFRKVSDVLVHHCVVSYGKSPEPTENSNTCKKRSKSCQCSGWGKLVGRGASPGLCSCNSREFLKRNSLLLLASKGRWTWLCPSLPRHPWWGEEKSLLDRRRLIPSPWEHGQDPRSGGLLLFSVMFSRRGRSEVMKFMKKTDCWKPPLWVEQFKRMRRLLVRGIPVKESGISWVVSRAGIYTIYYFFFLKCGAWARCLRASLAPRAGGGAESFSVGGRRS